MRTLCLGALITLAFATPTAQTPPRPNVVMFIMDDLGYGDVGSYGAPDAHTPNIDRLAREGRQAHGLLRQPRELLADAHRVDHRPLPHSSAALMRWPGRLGAGITSSQVGITMDLTASILAAAGVKPPAHYRPEGVDLVGLLQRGTAVARTLFWRLPPAPNAIGAPPVTQRAVRRGNWKYVDDRGQYFLFDLRADLGERQDVAQQHAI